MKKLISFIILLIVIISTSAFSSIDFLCEEYIDDNYIIGFQFNNGEGIDINGNEFKYVIKKEMIMITYLYLYENNNNKKINIHINDRNTLEIDGTKLYPSKNITGCYKDLNNEFCFRNGIEGFFIKNNKKIPFSFYKILNRIYILEYNKNLVLRFIIENNSKIKYIDNPDKESTVHLK
jgi:hypothetical protein